MLVLTLSEQQRTRMRHVTVMIAVVAVWASLSPAVPQIFGQLTMQLLSGLVLQYAVISLTRSEVRAAEKEAKSKAQAERRAALREKVESLLIKVSAHFKRCEDFFKVAPEKVRSFVKQDDNGAEYVELVENNQKVRIDDPEDEDEEDQYLGVDVWLRAFYAISQGFQPRNDLTDFTILWSEVITPPRKLLAMVERGRDRLIKKKAEEAYQFSVEELSLVGMDAVIIAGCLFYLEGKEAYRKVNKIMREILEPLCQFNQAADYTLLPKELRVFERDHHAPFYLFSQAQESTGASLLKFERAASECYEYQVLAKKSPAREVAPEYIPSLQEDLKMILDELPKGMGVL